MHVQKHKKHEGAPAWVGRASFDEGEEIEAEKELKNARSISSSMPQYALHVLQWDVMSNPSCPVLFTLPGNPQLPLLRVDGEFLQPGVLLLLKYLWTLLKYHEIIIDLQEKRIDSRKIMFHPLNPNYLVTGSDDGLVSIFFSISFFACRFSRRFH